MCSSEVCVSAGAAIPEGEVVGFTVEGRAIAVARSDSTLYAFDDRCSHEECPLSTGWVEDTEIECERHGARFSLVTGAVTLLPATSPIVVHEVTERDGRVFVSLKASRVAAE